MTHGEVVETPASTVIIINATESTTQKIQAGEKTPIKPI